MVPKGLRNDGCASGTSPPEAPRGPAWQEVEQADTPEAIAGNAELVALVYQALEDLPPRQRDWKRGGVE